MTSASALKPLPTPPPENDTGRDIPSSSPTRNGYTESAKQPDISASGPKRATYDDDEEFEFFQSFEREKVKDVIHAITAELKDRGADVEYLMIPFRPQQSNEKLLRLLNALFPMGNGQPVADKQMLKIIQKTEPLTLYQGLAYLWCRLPEGQVIGWKAYLEFKVREKEKDYPRRGFLELMPQCLSSPSHASIVYDFFDLIISLASNSRVNKMSARKISKMCAIWAFGKPLEKSGTPLDYDFTDTSELPNNSFQDGLDNWIPATDAMFHLLLAFLKSFVPQDLESAQLPLTLKGLLFNNDYPPKGSTAYSSQTVLTIPLVTLQTDRFSRKPWELLERCGSRLDFSKYDAFQAREDYALLKSLFKKSNQIEGISRKMSQESRRLMKLMSTKHSTFQAGWSKRKCLPNEAKLPESITINRVEIDDFFIWAWLATLSFEQTSAQRNLFGRSLILEFEFDGFKKWVLFQECDITLETRKRQRERDTEPKTVPSVEPPKDKKPPEAQRKVTPVYENFQKRVPSAGSHSSGSASGEVYHTVISKDSLAKNGSKHNVNLHAIEQKISKWNPLSKAKRKASSEGTVSSGASIETSQPRKESISITHHRSIYELPPIERDVDGFKDIFANHGIDDDDDADFELEPSASLSAVTQTKNQSDEAMEELKGMVDQMMTGETMKYPVDDNISSTTGNSTKETFESLTKFDQYKPTIESFADTPSTSSSAVPSLKLNGSVPSLQPLEPEEVMHSSQIPRPIEKQLPAIRVDDGTKVTQTSMHPQQIPYTAEKQLPEIRIDDRTLVVPKTQRRETVPQGKVLPARPHQVQQAAIAIPAPVPASEPTYSRSQSPPRQQAAGPTQDYGYGSGSNSPPRAMRPFQNNKPAYPRSQSPPRRRAAAPAQDHGYGPRSQSPPRPLAAAPAQDHGYGPRSQSPPRQPAVAPAQDRGYGPRSQSPPRQPAVAPAPDYGYGPRSQSPPRPLAAAGLAVDYAYAPRSQSPRQPAAANTQGYAYGPRSQSSPREPAAAGQAVDYAYAPRSQSPPRQPAAPAATSNYAYAPRTQPSAPPAHNYAPRATGFPPRPRQDHYASPPPAHHGPRSPEPRNDYNAPAAARPHTYTHRNLDQPHARHQLRSPQTQTTTQFYGHVDPSSQYSSYPMGMPKLHGGHTNRQQERKKLHNNIRNGDFGI